MTYDEIIKRLEDLRGVYNDKNYQNAYIMLHDLIEDLMKAKDNLAEIKISTEDANSRLVLQDITKYNKEIIASTGIDSDTPGDMIKYTLKRDNK